MSTYPSMPEDYIKAWAKLNQEMLEEGTPIEIKLPTIEQTQDWIDRNSDATSTI